MANALLTGCTISEAINTMDERLRQLALSAQRHPPETEERQKAIAELAEEILRSRKICRPPKGQPLSGIYLELYQQVRDRLACELDEKIDQYDPQRQPAREWANFLRDSALREVLDDAQLKKIAIEAQSQPPASELRQHALRELVEAIRLSGKLCRPHRSKFSPAFYELAYEEAVNQTLVYVCQKIDKYDPDRGTEKRFINWVNFRLDKILLDLQVEVRTPKEETLPTLADLENLAQYEESEPLLSDVLREFIEKDAKNLFKKKYIRECPAANFQAIALATLAGKSWEEISAEVGIKVPTLSSFFRRCCQSFAPIFRDYLL